MKITLISYVTPTAENCRAASALPYHIAKCREKDIELAIYSFNHNCVANEEIAKIQKDLECSIHLIPEPKWIVWLLKFHLLFVRMLLARPFSNYIKLPQHAVDEIKSIKPDGIWVYGEEMSQIVKQFKGYRIVHTLPDCESLYYKRMMEADFVKCDKIMLLRQKVMYPKYRRMESNFDASPMVTHHLVGEADAEELKNICSGIDARFIRHPHYEVLDVSRQIKFTSPIRLLVAGQYNLYMKSAADELFDAFCENHDLQQHYVITFLGRGWDEKVAALKTTGYQVEHIEFAPNYIEEICRHDIQLTPIAIGTGTKGKVLDALANGLLVIGTPYAMENIAVADGESCIIYNSVERAVAVLRDIPDNKEKYEQMAEKGRQAVLTHHGRKSVAETFFGMFQ